MTKRFAAVAALAMGTLIPAAALAQEAPMEDAVAAAADVAEDAAESAADEVVTAATMVAEDVTAAPKPCELHVWPTENYIGIKMGLLSGFGALGALADMESNKGKVTTIKDLMREYLGPDVQIGELERLNYVQQLKLDPAQYEIIMHEPTPFNEDVKKDKALKAEVKALNQKIKDGKRITDSTNACYAELITTHIFYHKAMMYGSNLFTGWAFRKFDGNTLVIDGKGQVKNPLEHFPPKEAAMIETAQAELRDAYSKDFTEWVEKKSGT